MAYIVCIDGNIGAGKTTVLQEIEKRGYKVYYEPFEGNPWLPLYYKNPKKYALNTQLWFLSERFRQYKNADFSTSGIVFIERSMYTDRFIFVQMILSQGNMSDIEYETYKHHFEIYRNPLPDLAITLDLDATECSRRIKVRDRAMEDGIPLEYLQKLAETYRDNFRKLGVETMLLSENGRIAEGLADDIIAQAEMSFAEYNR